MYFAVGGAVIAGNKTMMRDEVEVFHIYCCN
jgi:hypothetical protein